MLAVALNRPAAATITPRAGGAARGACAGPRAACALRPFAPRGRALLLAPARALGIFFSTTTGNTEEVADAIKEALGDRAADPRDIGDVDLGTLRAGAAYDGLIVGAPTWNTGADEQRSGTSWDGALDEIKALDLTGQKVAVFGCGDQQTYGDYFCDAMEELHTAFKKAGATMVGSWPTDGYAHSASKADMGDGYFCGLPIDQDNQDDLTPARVKAWAAQVLEEMGANVPA